MTLLLAAANPSGIHQSSDYRLTDPKTLAATENCGAKQLAVTVGEWKAQICFTGIAEANNVRTADLLTRVLSTAVPPNISELAKQLRDASDRHVRSLRSVPTGLRRLTIVIGSVEPGKGPRLILVSNTDGFARAAYPSAADHFEISERYVDRPTFLICGCARAVSDEDQRLLKHLSDCELSPAEIRERLAAINKRAADQVPDGRVWISTECFVSSLLRDGSTQSQNVGSIEGVPAHLFGGLNIGEFVQRNFRAAPGKKITLLQSAASGVSTPRPAPPPEGDIRAFTFSVPRSIARIDDEATITLEPNSETVHLRKNEWVSADFNAVAYSKPGSANPVSRIQLTTIPTVDGRQPRSWDYAIETTNHNSEHVLTIAPMSVAFRSANLTSPMPLLAAKEELVMVAPQGGLRLAMSSTGTLAAGTIKAGFLLRDFPELELERQREKIDEWKRIVGRNDPCPCGSRKKFKKCCGFLP
jgi:hypothetical protein